MSRARRPTVEFPRRLFGQRQFGNIRPQQGVIIPPDALTGALLLEGDFSGEVLLEGDFSGELLLEGTS